MAQTLKFGNKVWAAKEDSVLAYNDINNNYKPLPFTFSRASIGTRVNKDGLIETMGQDIARIDYTDSADGVLLLEPASTNYSVNSELPSTWTYTEFGSGSAGTITTGKTDMFGGTNAVQIDFPSNADNASVFFGSSTSGLTSGNCSISIYVKLVESGSKNLQLRAGFSDIVNINSTEFQRVNISGTKTNSEAFNLKLRPSVGTSSGGFSIIVCQPQEENNSYATSYIPTSGSTVTRAAETCNNSGNSEVFNDSEGVLFADISALADDGTYRFLSVSAGAYANSIRIGYFTTPNVIEFRVVAGGIPQTQPTHTLSDTTIPAKVAGKYKQNDFALWVNGFKVDADTNGNTPSGLSELAFDDGNNSNNSPFYGKTKELGYYDTALTDAELETLTSYRNWVSMVNELNLNIIYNG